MKQHCEVCGKKLENFIDQINDVCGDCIDDMWDWEEEIVEDDGVMDIWEDWVECPYCGLMYDVLDPYSECACYWMGDDEE